MWKLAGRTVWRGVGGAGWFLLGASLCVTAVAIAEVAVVVQIESDERSFVSAGGTTYFLSAPGAVDGQRCEAVGAVVGASGAMRPYGALELKSAPGTPLTATTVTPGWLNTIGTSAPPGGWAVPQGVAVRYGAASPSVLGTSLGAIPITAVFSMPEGSSRPDMENAPVAIQPADEQPYDECWLRTASSLPSSLALQYATTALRPAMQAHDVQFQQLNARLGESFDLEGRLLGRLSGWAVPLVALFGAAAGWFFVHRRGLDLSYARHLGAARITLVTEIAVEGSVICGVMVAFIALALTAVCATWASGSAAVVLSAGAVSASACLGIWTGCVLSAAHSTDPKRLYRLLMQL